ncbi:MAG: alpha-L-fucosidase, partial [Eubacteriales bacterium]
MITVKEYLAKIDEVIANGEFKDNWESLSKFKIPGWYQSGRFGIFIHWGCYSVAACQSEWYPRLMYLPNEKSCKHKNEKYGENFEYRQLVEMFNPDKFNADEWAELFKKSGAKYVMPVGEHHDGVKMYESDLNRWNMMALAPHRNFSQELHDACDRQGLGFLISSHRAEHYWFLNGARKNFPSSEALGEEYRDLYGPCALAPDGSMNDRDRGMKATTEWLEDWLTSSCEMVDKNKPLAMYFDWWVQQLEFRPYMKKFIAYYYNRAKEWGFEPAVFNKWGAVMQGCAVFDVERGQIDGISPVLWQCDTAIAKNS